jgi:succinate dehydrogenase hydrophobic anchor subunit
MVSAAVLLSIARIIGCAIAIPGLVAWALIFHRRRQSGIAVVTLAVAVLFVLMMIAPTEYVEFDMAKRGMNGTVSSLLVVLIALAILVSLRQELHGQWADRSGGEGKDCDGNDSKDGRSLIR